MNIAICEDELIYATGMQIAIQTWVQSRNYTDIQIFLYSSAEDLWDDWERGKVFDALFLDIEFQHMSGFELAQRIRCADPNIPIIFVTNSNRYLIQGYEVSAYRYLLKPIRQEEISACLDYCYQFTQTMLHDGFTIMRKGLTVRLPYRDVLYIMSGVHSIYIYTRLAQTYHIPLKGTFEHYASTFPQAYFLRCHRGYIVNIMHACQYTQKSVKLNTGVEIPIGRNFMDGTLSRLQQYFYSEAHV